MGKRLIIINRMYAGKYLTVGENIGHEVINLIRSDNGENYLWLNADGNCDISKFLKNEKCRYDEIVMLMVRMYGHRKWKVIAKAEIDTSNMERYMVPTFSNQYHKQQLEIIQKDEINYGGQPLNKIFDNNYFKGVLQNDIDIYFTFKAKSVLMPVMIPENMEKTVVDIQGLKGLANQSLRMYLTEDKNSETYQKFNGIVEGNLFDWEAENTTKIADINTAIAAQEDDYFLRIINEEYRELSFSNLLAYFLKNKTVMAGFAKEVLGLDDFCADAYSIAREEKNIDLFISSEKHYIIIENKIRSGLIRKDKKCEDKEMKNKVLEYYDVKSEDELPSEARELLAAFNSADFHYQTDCYYAYACGTVFRQKTDATISGYVLFPNYENHRITEQLRTALFKEHFKPITYRQVYSYFTTLVDSPCLSRQERTYLGEFLAAMKLHTKDIDNCFEEEMKNRFYARIRDTASRN